MNGLYKNESPIFVSLIYSLLPEDLNSGLILSSLQLVLCCVAVVKRLSVHIIVQIIFSGPLGSLAYSESV